MGISYMYLHNEGSFASPSFNSLPNNKILDRSKSKVFADNKINVTKRLKFILGRAENIVEKEKMLVTSIFSFSYNVSKRLLFQGH